MAKKFLDQDGLSILWGKIVALVGGKVDKVTNKGLSTNDFTDELKDKLENLPSSNGSSAPTVFFGTCDTPAATAKKIGVVADSFTLTNGVVVALRSANVTNTATNPTLNVNDTGEYPIWHGTNIITTGYLYRVQQKGYITYFAFDGNHWVFISQGFLTSSYSEISAANLASATSASVGLISGRRINELLASKNYLTAHQDISGKANSADLAAVATSGAYSDLTGRPTIPTVSNATITIKQGGVTKGSFGLNQTSGATINLDAGGGSVAVTDADATLKVGESTEVATVGGTAIHVTAPAPPLMDGVTDKAGIAIAHDVYLTDHKTHWMEQLFGSPNHPLGVFRSKTALTGKEVLGLRLTLHTAGWNTWAMSDGTWCTLVPSEDEAKPLPVMWLGHVGGNLVFGEYMACRWLNAAYEAVESKSTAVTLPDAVQPLTVTYVTYDALSEMLCPLTPALATGYKEAASLAQGLKGYTDEMTYTVVVKDEYSVTSTDTLPYNARWTAAKTKFLGAAADKEVDAVVVSDLITGVGSAAAPTVLHGQGVLLLTSIDAIK